MLNPWLLNYFLYKTIWPPSLYFLPLSACHPGVLIRDPTVWLGRAGPANICIPLSLLGNTRAAALCSPPWQHLWWIASSFPQIHWSITTLKHSGSQNSKHSAYGHIVEQHSVLQHSAYGHIVEQHSELQHLA